MEPIELDYNNNNFIREIVINFNSFVLNSSQVFITGHRFSDVDTIGSAAGFAYAADLLIREGDNLSTESQTPVYVVLDDKLDSTTQKLKERLEFVDEKKDVLGHSNFPIRFINKSKCFELLDSNSFILITDVNQSSRILLGDGISKTDKLMIVDHHHSNNDSLSIGNRYINIQMSSASEIAYRVLSLLNMKLSPEIATALLAGINLDTNNFTLKRSHNYFSVVADLIFQYGADLPYVEKLLGLDFYTKMSLNGVVIDNINEYGGVLYRFSLNDAKEKGIVHDLKQNKNELTAAIVLNKNVSDTIFLSKLANGLLGPDVDLALTIGKLSDGNISVHARSTGIIDAGLLLTDIGGGGVEMARGIINYDEGISPKDKVLSLLPTTTFIKSPNVK